MSAPASQSLRRGWCPSTLRPMETGDGWLVRLHPPRAQLTPSQLVRIAELARVQGNGLVEVSGRGNLQIRGVRPDTHPALVAALLTERLVDEHDGNGPQRLTLTSPLALPPPLACSGEGRGGGGRGGGGRGGGGNPASFDNASQLHRRSGSSARHPAPNPSPPQAGGGELAHDLIDAAALAEAIEAQGRTIPGLPAKSLVVVDGGGALALDGFACDLRLVALARDAIAIGLPDGVWLGPVTPEDAPDAVATILCGFATRHRDAPEAVRRLRDLTAEILATLSTLPRTTPPAPRPAPRRAGLFDLGAGRFGAIAGLPFGRCDAAVLARLGEAAQALRACSLRLSPWRGLACLGMTQADAARWLDEAGASGLITHEDDPRLSVQACAGEPACLRAQSDTMADAAVLAEAMSAMLCAGATLHVSGCLKSCARPGAADLTLVGEGGGYAVVIGGATRDEPVARLDLSAILRRLQPGQDLFARLAAAGTPSGPPV